MQVFANKEKLGVLTQTSNIAVQLSSSVITLGARQYQTGTLTCDLTTSGAGGIDTGSKESSAFYYIYVVADAGQAKLIASKSEQAPLGYAQHFKVGACWTGLDGNIKEALKYGDSTDFLSTAIMNVGSIPLGNPTQAFQEIAGNFSLLLYGDSKGDAWIPCSGSNPSTGITCVSGSEVFGLVISAPLAGVYNIQVEFNNLIVGDAVNEGADNLFFICEVQNDTNTVIRQSKHARHSVALTAADGTSYFESVSLSEDWTLGSGKRTIKIFKQVNSTAANPGANNIQENTIKIKANEDLIDWKRY